MNKKKTAKFGNVNIPAEDFQDKNVRIQISMKVPMDLLKAYRALAEQQGKGYQTLMQEVLRDALSTERSDLEAGVKWNWNKMRANEEATLKRLEKIENQMHILRRTIS